jgi:DNA repair exonuclease SbcCD ATPase subunit
MANDTLELLARIVDGLGALGDKSRGEPLRAADWNALIDGVTRLARLAASREESLQESLSARFAVADHAHQGQVTASWLAPETRALLEQANTAAQAGARVDALTRQVSEMGARMATLSAQVERLRSALDQVRDSADESARRATGAEGKLNALVDFDRRVTVLDGRFAKLSDDLRGTLAFRDTLKDPAGAPLDLRGLAGKVTELETLRESLKAADGSVIRGREIETRIAKLERDRVDVRTLDTRIGERLRDPAVLKDAEESIGSRLETRIGTRIGAVEGTAKTLAETVAQAREAAEAERARIDATETRLGATAARLEALGAVPRQLNETAQRLAAVETATRAQEAQVAALPELRTRLVAVETGTQRLPAQVETLGRRLAETTTRLEAAETGVTKVQGGLSRVTAIEGAIDTVRGAAERAEAAARSAGAVVTRLDTAEARIADLTPLRDRLVAVERDRDETLTRVRALDTRLARVPDASRLDDLAGRLASIETRTVETQRQVVDLDTTIRDRVVVTRPVSGGLTGGTVRPVRPVR